MKEKRENRRVRMTKRLMKDALLELLKDTELSNISVTSLCKAADINRSTFYNYYASPSELFREIEEEVISRIPVPLPGIDHGGEEQLLLATTGFFDYVKQNESVFRILFSGSPGSDFDSRLVDLLCSKYIVGIDGMDEQTVRFVRCYIANGTVGMLREWIDADFPISSREIAEMMYILSVNTTNHDKSALIT